MFTRYGYPRPDVARAYGSEHALYVGWNVEMTIAPGANQRDGFTVVVLSDDGLGKKVLTPRLRERAP